MYMRVFLNVAFAILSLKNGCIDFPASGNRYSLNEILSFNSQIEESGRPSGAVPLFHR